MLVPIFLPNLNHSPPYMRISSSCRPQLCHLTRRIWHALLWLLLLLVRPLYIFLFPTSIQTNMMAAEHKNRQQIRLPPELLFEQLQFVPFLECLSLTGEQLSRTPLGSFAQKKVRKMLKALADLNEGQKAAQQKFIHGTWLLGGLEQLFNRSDLLYFGQGILTLPNSLRPHTSCHIAVFPSAILFVRVSNLPGHLSYFDQLIGRKLYRLVHSFGVNASTHVQVPNTAERTLFYFTQTNVQEECCFSLASRPDSLLLQQALASCPNLNRAVGLSLRELIGY